MYLRTFAIIALAASLAGCGIFGGGNSGSEASAEPPVDSNRPATKELLKTLPRGLIGDTQNALHTNEELKGDGGTP